MDRNGAAGPEELLYDLRDVTKQYGHSRRGRITMALQGVSLQIRAGDRLGIVGESGSGKSTLAKVLLGLVDVDQGEVTFEGQRILGPRAAGVANLRRSVQIVFQDPMGSLDPRMSISDSIKEPLRALGIRGDHDLRVAELLDAVGLPAAAAHRYPHQFSGGQRQRIAIARALAPTPRVLIADEAVSALDVSVRAQILNLLGDLVSDLSLTLVFISHDMSVIRHMTRDLLVLYRGEVVESGPTSRVLHSPEHSYTKALLDAVPVL